MTGFTGRAGRRPPSEDGAGPSCEAQTAPALQGPPIEAASPYRGLALRFWDRETVEDGFGLALLASDGESEFLLGPFPEEDVVAVWRRLGQETGLELMIETPEGDLRRPYPQMGRVQLGAIRIRRRHGLLRERRPRFLTRRKTGMFQPRPLVHREREIAGGRGA